MFRDSTDNYCSAPSVQPCASKPVRIDVNGQDFLDVFCATSVSRKVLEINVPYRFSDCAIEFPVRVIVSLPSPLNQMFSANGLIRPLVDTAFAVELWHPSSRAQKLMHTYITRRVKETSMIFHAEELFLAARAGVSR